MLRIGRQMRPERGFDPHDFALLAFGSAGGLHACKLAASLEIATVLIPEHSGVLSALGMLLADVAKDYSSSMLQSTSSLGTTNLANKLQPLIERAQRDLAAEGFFPDKIVLSATLSTRYTGQGFEIDVPLLE